jgi:MFS family permease
MDASLAPGSVAARRAVGAVFGVNGALYANWVPRIPEVQEALNLGPGALGAALLGTGAGALVGSILAGPIISRVGSRRATVVGAVAMCAALPLIAVANSWLALLGALAIAGALDAVTDIAMNANALAVERRYRRSIMNAFHGQWSVGAVIGALTGSAAGALGLPLLAHFAITAAVLGVVIVLVGRMLLPASEDRQAAEIGDGPRLRHVPLRALGLLGLVAICSSIAEGAPADWSAVHLARDLDVPAGVAGLGYAAFSGAMLVMRLLGDRVVDRWGVVTTTRWLMLFGVTGLGVGLLIGHPVASIVGFACFGVGLATVMPALYAAAGTMPTVSAGAGIAIMTMTSRFGFMIAPPLIGTVATVTSVRAGLFVALAAAVAVVALAPAMTRDAPS